jgi:hypothetical protein
MVLLLLRGHLLKRFLNPLITCTLHLSEPESPTFEPILNPSDLISSLITCLLNLVNFLIYQFNFHTYSSPPPERCQTIMIDSLLNFLSFLWICTKLLQNIRMHFIKATRVRFL